MTRARDLSQTAGGTFAGDINVSNGTIKLDGNYPVGTDNVALGDTALDSLTSGNFNTVFGAKALTANTEGSFNVAAGRLALTSNTTGQHNAAIGADALQGNTTGSYNTALGNTALALNTTASNNTAVGYQAMYSYQTGGDNVALGTQAGYSINGNGNSTFIGRSAGYSTTGGNNTFIGYNSGNSVTSGSKNTIVGAYNGNQGGLDIRTSSNNIVLSDGDGVPRIHIPSNGNLWVGRAQQSVWTEGFAVESVGSSGAGTYLITAHAAGDSNTRPYHYFFHDNAVIGQIVQNGASAVSYATSSDYRLKENVVYDWDATTRLKQLKPARFNFITEADRTVDGFLAHEAQAVVPEAVHGTHNEVDDDGKAVMQGIDQSKLVPLLVKTIQELEARITALEAN